MFYGSDYLIKMLFWALAPPEGLKNPALCVFPPVYLQHSFQRIDVDFFSDTFYMKSESNKQRKVAEPFSRKAPDMPKIGKIGHFLFPKSTMLNIFLSVFFRFFLIST